jgi:uncharacterized membrane protein
LNIILVSSRPSKTRTLSLSSSRLVVAAIGMVLLIFAFSVMLQYFLLRHAANVQSPYLQTILTNIRQQENQKSEHYLRDNLNAMAIKLGDLQAQLLRLDALGQRLAQISGFKTQDFMFDEVPGRGGTASHPATAFNSGIRPRAQ